MQIKTQTSVVVREYFESLDVGDSEYRLDRYGMLEASRFVDRLDWFQAGSR